MNALLQTARNLFKRRSAAPVPTPTVTALLTPRPVGSAVTSAEREAIGAAAARSALPGMRAMSPSTPARRSWFGWMFGKNRRREGGPLVQGELLLQNVKPVRNSLRDDDVALVERRQSKVIWESPVAKVTNDNQELAWNRLRGRRMENLVVKPD